MPVDYERRLTAEQIDTVVAFLLDQKAPVTTGTEAEAAPQSLLIPAVVVAILVIGLILMVGLAVVFLRLPGDKGDS
jgi:uncharacterized membrane protein